MVRKLPPRSRLATALNDGQPVWTMTDHLLADVWAVLVKLLGNPDKVPDNVDNPRRAEMTAKVVAAAKKSLKEVFQKRKSAYARVRRQS